MIQCKLIAGQRVTLGAGDRLISGCELLEGSIFIKGIITVPPVGSPNGNPPPVISSPHTDTDGNIWVWEGTPSPGQWRLDSIAGGETPPVGSPSGDPPPVVNSPHADTDGNIWVWEGTPSPGQWILDSAGRGGIEVFPLRFVNDDDMYATAGNDGAVVIWPETGDDVFEFEEGESVPIGTVIHQGCVQYSDGETQCAPPPFTTNQNSVALVGPPKTKGSVGSEADSAEAFCAGFGVDWPGQDDKDFLSDLANMQIPELTAYQLSGFTAKITKMMSKLGSILGKLQMDVDKIMDQAKLNPEDVCTLPVKQTIRNMLSILKRLMKLIPILKKLIKVIKIIRKVLKLVKKILFFIMKPLKIVNKFMKLLNIMGLVDMLVGILLATAGRFVAIVPILQVQLMSILAQCAMQAGQAPPDNKEDCEAAGGIWIDPDELKELQDMYDTLTDETRDMFDDEGPDSEGVGFCSIPEHDNESDCESAGGTWTEIDTDTNLDEVDTSVLSNELALQLDELSKCFADPVLEDYLNEL